RAGHVHLGEHSADDIEPDEPEAVATEERPDGGANLLLARVQCRALALAPDVQIAARLVLARHAQDRADDLPVQKEDPFVSLAIGGKVALADTPLRAEISRRLEDRRDVSVPLLAVENPSPAAAIERLDDHLTALLGHEGTEASGVSRQDGRWHEL